MSKNNCYQNIFYRTGTGLRGSGGLLSAGLRTKVKSPSSSPSTRYYSNMGNMMSSTTGNEGFDGLGYSGHGIGPRPESREKLNQLLKANNRLYGVLFNNRKFHNHLPHLVISAYYLGATPKQLVELFEHESESLTPWEEDSPSVLTNDDLTDHFGDKQYERGFFDYFTDRLEVETKKEWYDPAREFLVDKGLQKGLFGGLLHPLIHMGYAVEANSEYVAVEALSLVATEWADATQFVVGTGSDVKKIAHGDILTLLEEFSKDPETAIVEHKNVPDMIVKTPKIGKYYAHRLDLSDKKRALQDLLYAGVAILVTSRASATGKSHYDFFLLHILTGTQALVEIVESKINLIPEKHHEQLIKECWATVLGVYQLMGRPALHLERIENYDISSVDEAWKEAAHLGLTSEKRIDSHYVKAIRAILFAEAFNEYTGDFYAKAALKFAREFVGQDYVRSEAEEYERVW